MSYQTFAEAQADAVEMLTPDANGLIDAWASITGGVAILRATDGYTCPYGIAWSPKETVFVGGCQRPAELVAWFEAPRSDDSHGHN